MRAFPRSTLASLCLSLGLLTACQANTAPAASSASSKIDPQVMAAARALEQGQATAARTDAQGRLQVYIHVADTRPDTLAKLARAGLADPLVSPEMRVVQGWVAPRDLESLAALPCVEKISFPLYASPR